MKTRTTFSYVPMGGQFVSVGTKRCFGGIRVEEITRSDGREVNAVILTDHAGKKADDAGHLVYLEPGDIVIDGVLDATNA